jgi:AcrR family transcriptional regulator
MPDLDAGAAAEPSAEPSAQRRRGRPGNDRETVLRRAIELFNRQGYDATSINDLAVDLGVSKSALYHHFASKEALLAAALDEALEGLTAAVASAADATQDDRAHDRLRATIESSVAILASHLPAVTLLLRVRGNSPLEQSALERRRHIDDQLATLVERAVAEGDLRDDVPPDLISKLVFGMVNSLVDWYRPDGPLPPETLAKSVADVLFQGLHSPR